PRTDQLFEQGYNIDVGQMYNRSQSVQGITSADFNGDGIPDIAATLYSDTAFHSDNSLSVLLGLGDGTYRSPQIVYRQDLPQDTIRLLGILAHDFDGDDIVDLIAGENGAKNLMFFKGHGNGAFDAPVRSPTSFRPQYLRTADLNGDDMLDIAMIGE